MKYVHEYNLQHTDDVIEVKNYQEMRNNIILISK